MPTTQPTLADFQATKVRCTYRDLIKDGSEPAATFIGIEPIETLDPTSQTNRKLDQPVLAYAFTPDASPNLFIEIGPNGSYYLTLGNYQAAAANEGELETLETELYKWGLSECPVDEPAPSSFNDGRFDDEDNKPSAGPSPC